MNAIVPAPEHAAMPRPPIVAGARPTALVPQSMDEAYRLANAVCEAGLAPQGLDKPAKAMIAIMAGLEVGMTPMQSLQRIAVVNGRVTIWGDGAIGLVRGSGLCEFVRERIDGEGDARAAVCSVKRRGEPEEVTRRFSVADARTAGLWGKGGPWKQYPDRMLQMRARAFALRDVFADVLGGLYIREEIEDDRPARASDVPPPPPPPSTGVAQIAPPPPPVEAPAPASGEPPAMTAAEIVADITERLDEAQNPAMIDAALDAYELEMSDGTLSRDHLAEIEDAAEAARKRVGSGG
jgi:hypothetical protein